MVQVITADQGGYCCRKYFGRKFKVQDPEGRVGVYQIQEHRTHVSAPKRQNNC